MTRLLLLVLALPLAAQRLEQGYTDIENKTLDIYWTDNAPTIDGRDADGCWETAALAGEWTLVRAGGAKPSQPSTARVCYDARALYVFFHLHEADMENMKPGPAPDMRDILEEKEKAFLQVDPGCTRQQWFEFAASPRGAWSDRSKVAQWEYSPSWQLATGRFPGGWTVEMAVPFTELVHPGEWRATPQIGDCWGMNFNRVRSLGNEQSQWTRTFGFHFYGHYGRAVFRGRRQRPQPPTVRRIDNAPLGFGPGLLAWQVNGADPTITGNLEHDGEPQAVHPGIQDGIALLPYHITEGGRWTAEVTFRTDERPVYTCRAVAELPRLREDIARIEDTVERGRAALADAELPAADALRAAIDRLAAEVGNPRRWLARANDLSRADWQLAEQSAAAVRQLWQEQQFDLNRLRLYPGGDPAPAFGVATVGPTAKIQPRELYEGPLAAPIKLAGAGNEYESCQLVVIPFWTKLPSVDVAFSDLQGPDGTTIPAAHLRWFRIDYVHQMADNPYVPRNHEREPDILRPGVPVSVPADRVQPLWVDVFIPAGTAPGEYRGTVSVTAAGQTIAIPMTLTAYGFDIPKHPTIRQNHWFSYRKWQQFYGTWYDEQGRHLQRLIPNPELYANHVATLAEYRVQTFPFDTISQGIVIYHDAETGFSFDFSALDPYIELGCEQGANALWANFSCNLGGLMTRFRVKYADRPWVIDKATGQPKSMAECNADWIARRQAGEVTLHSNPVFLQFIAAFAGYLRDRDMLDMAYWETYDEPYSATDRWLDMIDHHAVVEEYAPGLIRFAFGATPLQVYGGKSAIGSMDAWAPHLFECDNAEMLAAIARRRRDHGERFWMYTCTERQSPATGNFSPHTFYNRSYAAPRIIPWMARKLDTDGFLIYMLSAVSEQELAKAQEERYPASEWRAGRMRGNGTLIYPGPDLEVLPGMRLANLRDGMEDYEYFGVLEHAAAGLDPDSDLAKQVRAELTIEPEIIASVFDWTEEVDLLAAKRARLAALIRACQQP